MMDRGMVACFACDGQEAFAPNFLHCDRKRRCPPIFMHALCRSAQTFARIIHVSPDFSD